MPEAIEPAKPAKAKRSGAGKRGKRGKGSRGGGQRRGKGVEVKKDAFYIRVDGSDTFESATRLIGQKMPFTKPRATSAMRVYANNVIAFSTMLISNKQRERIVEQPISVPVSPLTRLERRATELADILLDDVVVVEREHPDTGENQQWTMQVRTTDGTTYLDGEGTDTPFNLAIRKEKISVFMRSNRSGRVLAVGFLGHLDKPGRPETPARAAAKILNNQTALADFALLSGITSVHVPPQPGSRVVVPTMDHKATFTVDVTVFTGDNQPAGTGTVKVSVDLRHTAPGGQSLQLAEVVPSAEIAGVFEPVAELFTQTVVTELRKALGDDMADVLYAIVLGEADDRTVAVVVDAAEKTMPAGLDLSPFGYRLRTTAAA